MLNKAKKIFVLISIGTTLYLFLSFINILFGGYVWGCSGLVRSFYGNPLAIAAPDLAIWMPYFGYFEFYKDARGHSKIRSNACGYIFAVPIVVDHMVWHKTYRVVEIDGRPVVGDDRIEHLKRHPRY